jgi:hypothetical protein
MLMLSNFIQQRRFQKSFSRTEGWSIHGKKSGICGIFRWEEFHEIPITPSGLPSLQREIFLSAGK